MTLAVVAGSGLSALASILQIEETIPFEHLLSDGFERLHRQGGMKILVAIGTD